MRAKPCPHTFYLIYLKMTTRKTTRKSTQKPVKTKVTRKVSSETTIESSKELKGIKRLLYITLAFVVAGAMIAIIAFISNKWIFI